MIHEITKNEPASALFLENRRKNNGSRRQRNIQSFLYSLFMNRRTRQDRRLGGTSEPVYVDIHEPVLLVASLLILLLCITDAFITLFLLNHGGVELNPFMAYFIEIDKQIFFIVKYVITASCIVFLLAHKRFYIFRLIRVENIMAVILLGYTVLIQYEIYLINTNLDKIF